ncbi:hypothetical protein [Hungatella sp.]|uniref:hypothetical protein n=1 Tax=Hungatella sp. TaxID=2613924 RepID=UPI003AB8DC8F
MEKTFESIKNAVDAFDRAAKIIYSEEIKIPKEDLELDSLIMPGIVLNAFSCELALKAIGVKRGIDVKHIHFLDKLFFILPEEDKDKISKKVIEIYGITETAQEGYNRNSFDKDLKSISNVFEECRYFYECSRTVKLIFLLKFSQILTEYINTI